ncbi:PTS mannitol transporter subunit IICB [Actinoallomurus iriomotensis]|uniref:PTS system mannitol-specific EIICB component n=1 Tax=Actinoallomurus iriomotensis TaxID=478107 RepID=A0A9W6RZQ1_9ACTN|nr:PTS mannitol transporter subunit IICB [Actinoallomurus iriomotensis]GLY84646.1 PTS system mannitol-specific EIICB component [Actinoallomurus iriomotensis]
MATPYTPQITGQGPKAQIQRLGGHLAGMVMPNIGAFIAWGLITALFIPTGWLPNKEFGALVDPTINVLLPVLIGYTGGRMVHGQRGAVVGAVATIGVVVGAGIPMFLGAMVMGPLTAYVLKLVDGYIQDRTKPGFEMLVDNFTAGIIGGAAAVFGNWGIKPIVTHVTDVAGNGVEWLIHHHLLPLASVLVEPAKVLFLNNAVNHGVLGPLGVAEAAKHGKSIMFMIESNPGPGLGVLAAYLLFGPRTLRPSVPAAMVIQFLGGIHEIYFPYILMKPRLILATMAGGAAGIGTFMVTGAGLVATPSPGSIFAYAAETPRGGYFGVFLGILIAAGVSFAVGSVLLGFGRFNGDDESEAEAEAAPETTDGEATAAQTMTDETKTDEAPAPETAPHGA